MQCDNLVVDRITIKEAQVSTTQAATIADVRHGIAAVNGTRLHHVIAGDHGAPVLLVHGFPETWWAFRDVIPLLATRHRVCAVDLRGFGDSDHAEDDFSSAVAAEDLHALIEHLAMGPMHVVGQDVSGGVVHRLAATHPEDVASLTAVESGLAGFGAERLADVTRGGAWYIGALAAPRVASLIFEQAAHSFIGEYLYPLYRVSPDAVGTEDVAEYARTYGTPGGFSGAAGLYRSMLTEGQELRSLALDHPLQIPVTTVGSRGTDFTRTAFQDVTAKEVTAVQLDGVGHYIAQEAPHELAAILLDTFATVAR